MHRITPAALATSAAIAGLVAFASPARAALDLGWHTVDGGGITFATGGTYTLGATIGQPDAGVLAGGSYQLKGGFWRGGVTYSTSVPGSEGTDPAGQGATPEPMVFRYRGAAPNPFNPKTVITFRLPERRDVTLRIYSATGELVRELVSGALDGGDHQVNWDGDDDHGRAAASGVYYLKLVAGTETADQKLVLMK